MLRITKGMDFLHELYQMGKRGETKKALKIKRALDGKEIEMTMDEVWTHLNFHLLHALDFLPAAGWTASFADPFMTEFCALYCLLKANNKIENNMVMPCQIKTKLDDIVKVDSLHKLY